MKTPCTELCCIFDSRPTRIFNRDRFLQVTFYSFAVVAYALVAGVVIFVEIPRLYKNYRNWLKS